MNDKNRLGITDPGAHIIKEGSFEPLKKLVKDTFQDTTKHTVGKKYDAGKAPVVQGFFNYFPQAIQAAALVSKYGADKYEVAYKEQNWRDVENGFERYTDAAGRHILSESIDGLFDPESGLLHAAHALWNAAARLELLLRKGTPLGNPYPDAVRLADHVRERYESTGSVL